jgi:aromatic ring-opening dioxygenase LigB subunit
MSILASFMVPTPPIIIPGIGKGGERQIEETSRNYERVAEMISEIEPETLVIATPTSAVYSDYFHISPGDFSTGSFEKLGSPRTRFIEQYDKKLVQEIERIAKKRRFPAGTLGEIDRDLDTGTMIPLWFIRQKLRKYKIIRVGLSGLPLTDHYILGQIISEAVERLGRKAVFIASGDLSQKVKPYGPFGYSAEGPVYDYKVMDICQRAAFKELLGFDEAFLTGASECSHRQLVIMAGAMDGREVVAQKLSYQDVTGVGYGICSFIPGGMSQNRRFLDMFIAENTMNETEEDDGL